MKPSSMLRAAPAAPDRYRSQPRKLTLRLGHIAPDPTHKDLACASEVPTLEDY